MRSSSRRRTERTAVSTANHRHRRPSEHGPAAQNAVASIASNTTILIAPGTYQLTSPLYENGSFTNVAIRGASDNRDDVVLVGRGMTVDGGVPFGIWTGGNVRGG